jgi:hypothetical protein
MKVDLQISDRVALQLERYEADTLEDMDQKLTKLLESELRRRFARYDLTDRQMSRKYGLSFLEFERQQDVQKMDYSWEFESDAIAWETAIDGKATVERQLFELLHGHD